MYDAVFIKEELDRKAVDALEQLARQNVAGEINDRELFIAVTALYDTTSGLIDETVQRMIAGLRKTRSVPT